MVILALHLIISNGKERHTTYICRLASVVVRAFLSYLDNRLDKQRVILNSES